MMSYKRAFSVDNRFLQRPAKKRSFLGRDPVWSFRDDEVSITSLDLSAIKVELKQGLYHIVEALRIAQDASADISSLQLIADAKDMLQRFVRNKTSEQPWDRDRLVSPCPSRKGWFPMDSQLSLFPPEASRQIPPSQRQDREGGRGWGRGGFSVGNQFKPARRAMFRSCKICNRVCNSEQQWEEHLKGKTHQARLEGAEPPRKLSCGDGDTKIRKTCDVCDLTLLAVDFLRHINGKRHKNNVKQAKLSQKLMFTMHRESPDAQRDPVFNSEMHEVAIGEVTKKLH